MVTVCDVLVVAAFEPELLGLEALLGAQLQANVGGQAVIAAPVGIGLVASAIGMANRLHGCRPRAVVLVGTAGAYRESGLSVGDFMVARSTLLVDPAALEGRAALPDVVPSRLETTAAMTEAIASKALGYTTRLVDVATTLAVTTDDALALRLGNAGAVEHLEAFAVHSACRALDVPFAAVLGVANRVGSAGRAEWRANHVAAGREATKHVARWLEAGAPGMPGIH